MATRTIYVSKEATNNNLVLRDSEGHNPGNDQLTTDVRPGDTVIWELDPTARPPRTIYSLEGVMEKPFTTVDLLVAPPTKSDNQYQGTVTSATNKTGQEENYNIRYKVTSDGQVLTDDPKLKMI